MDFELKRAEKKFDQANEKQKKELKKLQLQRQKQEEEALLFKKSLEEKEQQAKLLLSSLISNSNNNNNNNVDEKKYMKNVELLVVRKENLLADSNRVTLPSSLLQELTSNDAPYPYFFKIERKNPNSNENEEIVTHVGVLEFSEMEGCVGFPNNLWKDYDGVVNISFVRLEKGKNVTLMPNDLSFFHLPDHKSLLENSLRLNRCCLTINDEIAVMYGKNRYILRVVHLSPESAVSVLNTDVEVTFASEISSNSNNDNINNSTITRTNIVRKRKKEIQTVIIDGIAVNGEVFPNFTKDEDADDVDCLFYKFQVTDTNKLLTIKLSINNTINNSNSNSNAIMDCDFYVSDPSSFTMTPTCVDNDYFVIDTNSTKILNIEPPSLLLGTYYVCVQASGDVAKSTNFTLSVSQTQEGIQQVSHQTQHVTNTSGEELDKTICENCFGYIPTLNYMTHLAFCSRNLKPCMKCKLSFRKGRDFDKHQKLVHSQYSCSCNTTLKLEMPEMRIHKRQFCVNRLSTCRFCGAVTVVGDTSNIDAHDKQYNLTVHESECGSRSAQCDFCKKTFLLKMMPAHLKLVHNNININK